MDNLRLFLESRVKKKVPIGDPWHQLTRTMDKLKKHDLHRSSDHTAVEGLIKAAGIQDICAGSTEDTCIEVLRRVSIGCGPPHALLPADESLPLVDAAIEALKQIYTVNNLSKHQLANALLDFEGTLPVQLLCKLQNAGLLQISTYAFRKFRSGNEQLLSDAILWLLTHSSDSSANYQMAMDVFTSLLIASQSGPLNLQLSNICAANVKKCIESIVNWVLNCSELDFNPFEESIDFSYLLASELWSACGCDLMQNFALTHLLHLLSEHGVPVTTEALLHAVEMQEKTTLETIPQSFRNFLKLIVKALDGEKIVHHLGAAVVRPSVNWKIIFLLTASLVTIYPNCCNDMRRLTDELIQQGLEGGRQLELAAGFLLARQCCITDSKNFSTYSSWFSSNFGPDSVTARNTIQFQSLMQVLTDIVPAESPENLRIHINKVPQAPTSCHAILRDYTALVRTRLADLNESSEMAGLFSVSKYDPVPGLDFRQGDIVKVLQHFKQTQEIMKPVLEASIFRRSYYRNVFLVELLGLPGSSEEVFNPEDFDLDNGTRHEFILALKSLGKIPDKLFKVYDERKSSQELNEALDTEVTRKQMAEGNKCESIEQYKKKRSLKLKRGK